MLSIKKFTFNQFQENTFVLFDETKNCAIIDPGCWNPQEQKELSTFISENSLNPTLLLNTHCHIDHVLGNAFIHSEYSLTAWMHKDELPVLKQAGPYAAMMGMNFTIPPTPTVFLEINTPFKFGTTLLEILFTPGHSPGHVSFYHAESGSLFSGDVIFRNSIGRTDLPGGNYNTLMDSIINKVLTLPLNTKIYNGHGFETTVGAEKVSNPFVLEAIS